MSDCDGRDGRRVLFSSELAGFEDDVGESRDKNDEDFEEEEEEEREGRKKAEGRYFKRSQELQPG